MNALDLVSLENLAVSVTFVAGLVAMAAFILHLGTRRDWLHRVGQLGMGVALVGSGGTLVARALIAQHAPWSNLWESMVTMLFATLAFYFLVEVLYKPRFFGVVASPLVMILIGGASILPPSFKGAAPLMPALQSYWIKVHVLLVLASYAAFTMSFAASLAYLYFSWRSRVAAASPALAAAEGPAPAVGGGPEGGVFGEPLRFFDELSYRLILMGFPLLMFGIITGAMWANGAWGTYWSWDPKETWSLITWFVYAAYLHARLTHDWTGTRAAWLGVLGFASMIVTYIGVNYLSSGLHSYGFIR